LELSGIVGLEIGGDLAEHRFNAVLLVICGNE